MQPRFAFLGFGCALLLIMLSAPGSGQTEPGERRTPEPSVLSAREAADRIRTKVVILKSVSGATRSSATGLLVRPRLVLTVAHAVKPEAAITAWVNGVSYRADLLGLYPDYDLAVLGLRGADLLLKPAELADTSAALQGNDRLLILAGPSQPANAHGDPVDRVPIPAVYREKVWLRLPNGTQGVMLKMDAAVERGDSGSPVIRIRDGKVIGVLSSRELPDADGTSRIAYAVPVEAVAPRLQAAAGRLAERDEAGETFYLRRAGKR